MKRLLIMVQSCIKEPYPALMKAQQETWDSMYTPNVQTVYYYGGEKEYVKPIASIDDKTPSYSFEYCSGTSEAYEMMHWKFKLAMDFVSKYPFDFMFRTNASTYVNKELLLKYIQDKPTEKYYSGVIGGDHYVSGTNALMSRDCVEIARTQFSEHPTPSEDSYLGTILTRNGIIIREGCRRPHFNFQERVFVEAECYRCKSPDSDRTKDITAFKELYNYLHGKTI